MKKVKFLYLAIAATIAFTACKEDEVKPTNNNPQTPVEGISGDMNLITFQPNTTYKVAGDLKVPQNQTVTIPEGVRLEFQEGANGEAFFIEVYGSLRIRGTAANRVVLTASNELINSSKNQGIGQLWGGIIGTNVAGDLVIEYTDILYAGGACREENAMAKPETGGGGELSAGDASYAIYYIRQNQMRQDGIFVLTHSRIAFTPDDAIRINGGKTLMTYNTFEVTGGTGGDAVNIKAGTSGDFAFNLFYSLATNGLKSADTGPGERGKCQTNFYNNTILNSGYRRAEPGRGAGLNYESAAYGSCYNNLLVNNRFGLRLVRGENAPDTSRLFFGYNWYYGAVQTIVNEFYPSNATSSQGLIGYEIPKPTTDVADTVVKANNPLFVNFDPSTFTYNGTSTDPLRNNINPIPSGANFRLQATSPALTGGFTNFSRVHASYSTLTSDITFTPPAPAVHFGAYGVN